MITKLEKLNRKLDIARAKYDGAIGNIEAEIIKLTGCDNIVSTDFSGDGLGIGLSDDPNITHTPIETLIKILEEKGSLDKDDILNNTSL